MSRRTSRAVVCPFATLAVLVAACGGGVSETAPPAGPAEPSPMTSAATPGAGPTRLRSHAAPDDGAPPAAEPRGIDPRFAALFTSAEAVRELTFASPPRVSVESRREIVEHLLADIEEEELAKSSAIYVALGLLHPNVDVVALLRGLVDEQVVGYYDTRAKKLAVRDEVLSNVGASGSALDESGMVLVHELVHALQDQRLGLGVLQDDESRSTDADNALRFLVEGDATLAMLGHVLGRLGQPLSTMTAMPGLLERALDPSMLAGAAGQGELNRAPPIVRIPLLYAYVRGAAFAAHLHRQRGFGAIDDAYRALPASTEQTLHPEKYDRREPPIAVTLPPLPALEGQGFQPVHEDTLGELEASIFFGIGTETGIDPVAGAGWGGDRVRVYRNARSQLACIWQSVWDTDADAAEAATAARRVQTAAHQRAGGFVAQRGRVVLVVRGVPRALHPQLSAAIEAPSDATAR